MEIDRYATESGINLWAASSAGGYGHRPRCRSPRPPCASDVNNADPGHGETGGRAANAPHLARAGPSRRKIRETANRRTTRRVRGKPKSRDTLIHTC